MESAKTWQKQILIVKLKLKNKGAGYCILKLEFKVIFIFCKTIFFFY